MWRGGDGSGDGDGVVRLLISDHTTTFPCWWRRLRGAGGGGGESGAFLGYGSQCGSVRVTSQQQPLASQRPGPHLHDESESLLLVISLSAQIIALAFSDVVPDCVKCLKACAKRFPS